MLDLGYALIPGILDADECDSLALALTTAVARSGGASGNLRNLLRDVPAVAALARSARVLRLVEPWIGPASLPVRALLFDKTPGANWSLGWHQDLAIAVKRRVDVPGFGGWSVKQGVPHVLPPASVLEQMVAVRLHLDDCDASNGALQVLPGSHREGRLDESAAQRWRASVLPFTCEVARGGALVIRPLLLHASAPATEPRHRRVIHIDYANSPLPGGLEWFEENAP